MKLRWLALVTVPFITAVGCGQDGPMNQPTPTTEIIATPVETVAPTLVPPTPIASSGWARISPMNTGRTAHSATLLNDGKVMVAGGLGHEGALSSVEIFDPGTGVWSPAADMAHPRRNAVLATLSNGKVIAAGGSNQLTVSTAELFDPETGMWTELKPMNVGRESAMTVPLKDGRLFVFGGGNDLVGGDDGQFELKSAEVFDPQSNTWTLVEPMAQAEVGWEGWAMLDDGRVLLTGGDFARPNQVVQIFDPATDSWEAGAELPGPISGGATVLLPYSRALVAGGGLRCCLTESLVYDVVADSWSPGPEMLVERAGHIGLNMPDGRIVYLFGLNPDLPFDDPYRNGEILDTETGETEELPAYPGVFEVVNAITVLQDGKLLLAGGRSTQFDSDGNSRLEYSRDAYLLVLPER